MNIQLIQKVKNEFEPEYYVGCSGWHYDHWRILYYPPGTKKTEWLSFYAKQFNTVEINSSFYRLPSERALIRWRENTPDNFIFAIKASRFITHVNKLRNCRVALGNFLSRVSFLKSKLGPLLYQLPPSIERNDDMLCGFLDLLPHGYRHVFEFRHDSWINEAIFHILQQYNVALCIADIPNMDFPLITTSDFAYIRFHGNKELYSSCYSNRELLQWSQNIINLNGAIKAVYIYFNNDAKAFAVKNAQVLMNYLATRQ
jgi:uncharacterized protein YecE (DUF72 family)